MQTVRVQQLDRSQSKIVLEMPSVVRTVQVLYLDIYASEYVQQYELLFVDRFSMSSEIQEQQLVPSTWIDGGIYTLIGIGGAGVGT
jgi:hypothetical protein